MADLCLSLTEEEDEDICNWETCAEDALSTKEDLRQALKAATDFIRNLTIEG